MRITMNRIVPLVAAAAAQEAAQLQQPFGGDTGALLFHNH